MPELPDPVFGETVEEEWGADIGHRVLSRYANTAERTADHGTPELGDFSFLEDTKAIHIYNGSAWVVPIAPATVTSAMLAGSVAQDIVRADIAQDNSGPIGITTTMADRVALTFTKPASWATYFIMAWGSAHASSDSGKLQSRVEIGLSNGTTILGQTASCIHQVASASGSPVTIALACSEVAGGAVVYENSSIAYVAYRLT